MARGQFWAGIGVLVALIGSGLCAPVAAAAASGGRDTAFVRSDGPTDVRVSDPTFAAVNPATDTAYVAVYSGPSEPGSVDVVDMATGKVTATVRVGSDPTGIAVDPATNRIYVANFGSASVSVISGASNSVTATISGGSTWRPTDRDAVAVDQATDTIYVAVNGPGLAGIEVVNGATNTVTDSITGPSYVSGGLALNAVTDTIYAVFGEFKGAPDQEVIELIAGGSDKVGATIDVQGSGEFGIAADTAADRVDVTSGSELYSYDGATGVLAGSASNVDGDGIAVDPVTDTVIACTAGRALLLAGESLAVTGRLNPGCIYTAVNPDTGTVVLSGLGALTLAPLCAPVLEPRKVTFTVGKRKAVTVHETCLRAPVFSATSRLPAGLMLTSGGVLEGKPRPGTGGQHRIGITAANGVQLAAHSTLAIDVDQVARFTSHGRARFHVGIHQTFTIRTSGFPAAVVSERGKLPAGLRFVTEPGGKAEITGTAARSARGRTVVVRLVAKNHVGRPATQKLTIQIRG
jgi:YVTN family beta-propeller protein